MEFKDYIEVVLSLTCETPKNVNNKVFQLHHAGMGMQTEAAEVLDIVKKLVAYGKPVDVVNLIEELGDCMWYCGLAVAMLDNDNLGVLMSAMKDSARYVPELARGRVDVLRDHATRMVAIASMFASNIETAEKSRVEENRIKRLKPLLINEIAHVIALATVHNFIIEEVLDANAAKLRKRYGDKFDQDKAMSRDLFAERQILEASVGA